MHGLRRQGREREQLRPKRFAGKEGNVQYGNLSTDRELLVVLSILKKQRGEKAVALHRHPFHLRLTRLLEADATLLVGVAVPLYLQGCTHIISEIRIKTGLGKVCSTYTQGLTTKHKKTRDHRACEPHADP
ncbi:hypothetical protein PHYSODRAFT_305742 [Phytophthora sojae]|uniref:Uncharacterized protein n=1 Tax=Phytophthora sojae (strain P6497) TaxID=1094619 RepID=G5A6D1_PHYSP|nr:hypothetical protein PHYSODRAFT_305742 [Phytophthora sojae]EGZ08886.1 hypothetical protein PHYSODRAFT_305742 [Phytophthora sojae]|eukprot:XP_009535519.1 hypothetical protein PHYSODRAFT_305742 [Phytophthora sojae]